MKSAWIAVGKRIVISLFLSFLFLRSTASTYWSELNRFFFLWQRTDTLAVLLAIVIVACLFYIAYWILSRSGKWGRIIFQVIFIGFALFYFKINLGETLERYSFWNRQFSLYLKFASLVIFLVCLFKRDRAIRMITAICLILSPILVMYAGTLIIARPYQSVRIEQTDTNQTAITPKNKVIKIFIVVFDAWSYGWTFDNGKVIEDLPSVSYAAEHSIVFHEAYSTSWWTRNSVLSLLCGKEGILEIKKTGVYFTSGGESMPVDEYPNIFKAMKRRGYRTALYGIVVPYPELFLTGLDHCESKVIYKFLGQGILQVCISSILGNLQYRLEPFFPFIARPFYYVKHKHIAECVKSIQDSTIQEIRDTRPSFVYIHQQVAHPPYIFNRNGVCKELSDPSDYSDEGYRQMLLFADTLLGEILAEIEKSPYSDRTMLIIMSDHGDRNALMRNPDLTETPKENRHVPLLIHLPGQTKQIDVYTPFSLVSLKEMILSYLDTEMEPEEFAKLSGNSNKYIDIRENL